MSNATLAHGELQASGLHALVVTAEDERQAMVLMDRHDLDQALAELRGDVIEQFVYVVPERRTKGGKIIPAKQVLTYAGIKEAARLYKNVHFGAGGQLLPDGTWMLTSFAHNLADNTRIEYPMPYPAFDAKDSYESTDFRANLSKSIRNALAAVLPVAYLNTMIKKWLEQKEGGPASALDIAEMHREIAVLLGYDEDARASLKGQDWTLHPLPKLVEMRRRLVDRAEKRLALTAPAPARPTPEELAPDLVTVTEDGEVVLDAAVIDVVPEPTAARPAPTAPDPVPDKRRTAVLIQEHCQRVGRVVPQKTGQWIALSTELGMPAISKQDQMTAEWFDQVLARLRKADESATTPAAVVEGELVADDDEKPIGHSAAYVKWQSKLEAARNPGAVAALMDQVKADDSLDPVEAVNLDALGTSRYDALAAVAPEPAGAGAA